MQFFPGAYLGTPLSLEGRAQTRIYTKVIEGQAEERTAYEVSVMQLVHDGEEP